MNGKEISVVLRIGEKQKALKTVKGRRLQELISDAGISFAFPCGGNGRCGKCIVTFTSGAPAPKTIYRNFLKRAKDFFAGALWSGTALWIYPKTRLLMKNRL